MNDSASNNNKRSNIEVVMIVRDEEINLVHSLPTIVSFAQKVWLVDSGSKDRTVEIAVGLGCEVVSKEWLGFARQKNWALDNLPLTAGWILILDADESVTPKLRDKLVEIASRPQAEVIESGFHINRYFVFLGGVIKHCGYYPSWNLRFFKRGRSRYEEREVHEHMLADGAVGFIHADLEHNDRRSLEHYISKHNHYSTLEARAIHGAVPDRSLPAHFFGGPIERRRWIKRNLYSHLPAKFICRFMWMYFLKFGFLDGMTGLRFSLFISAYELQIEQKLVELQIAQKQSPHSA